jgi:hypothetical protein
MVTLAMVHLSGITPIFAMVGNLFKCNYFVVFLSKPLSIWYGINIDGSKFTWLVMFMFKVVTISTNFRSYSIIKHYPQYFLWRSQNYCQLGLSSSAKFIAQQSNETTHDLP